MRKFLTWSFVSVVALLAMGLAALDLLNHSTARERDAVISKVRARAGEKITRLPSLAAAGVPSAESQSLSAPVDNCEAQAARWEALEESFRLPRWEQDRAARELYHEMENGARAVINNRFKTGDFGEAFWPKLDTYVDSRTKSIESVKSLLFGFEPDCGFLQELETPEYWYFDHLLDVDLAAALHWGNFDMAIENLAARVSLSYMTQGYRYPHRFEPEYALIIMNALKSGVVRQETWQRFLRAMRAYRDRDFMIHYVRNYPHLPFGATVQESSYIKRGVRAIIWEVQEPALNKDAARFAPVLEELAALSAKPFYIAKPELDKLIMEYDLTPHERHSYLNESAARASIVNLVQVVFPRNAVVQAQIDLFSIAIALDLARIRLGHYPPLLEGAAELLGGTIPLNPLNGTPYRYETTDTGFRLGVEFAEFVPLPLLKRKSDALWVEMANGELRVKNSE